jgi:MATE family multidrug resistance protein
MAQGLLRGELRRLARLAVPVAFAQLAVMAMGFVDLLMVGRLSVEAFAAVGLANPWIFGTMLFANGIILGIDPIVTQAHGAGDQARAGLALQRGIVAALLLSPLVMLLFALTEDVLLLLGQDPALAAQAQSYTRVQIPSVPFFLMSSALRQYLQGRELVRPGLYVVLVGNVFNALFNGVLIFGWGGFPALGLVGAGIATALTRVLSFALLLGWVRVFRLHVGAWVPWSLDAIAPRGLLALFAIGLPIAVQMSLEMWAFSGSSFIAGRLGALDLAAHQLVMNLASITFMLPLGISQAVVIRVGNLLGQGRRAEAQRAAWVGMGLGAAVMSLSAFGFVVGRHALPRIYTPDLEVIAAAAAILPFAAAFQIFDGTQVVACGVLRGMGRPLPAALFNFVGYWVLALPIGGWLALRTDYGLSGLWGGLCLGLVVVALCLIVWIARRGPAYSAPTG